MANSDHPATQAYAARLASLCDAPPQFRNLDLLETWIALEPQPGAPEREGARN